MTESRSAVIQGKVGERVDKRTGRNFEEWGIYATSWLWWLFHRYIHMLKVIKFYTLNMGSLFYVHYITTKLVINKNNYESVEKIGIHKSILIINEISQ